MNRDVGGSANGGDLLRAIESAHFPQFDADRIHRTRLDMPQRVSRGLDPFIRHNRYGNVLTYECHSANIVAVNRLLTENEMRFFKLSKHSYGLHRRIGLIRIDGH